MRVLWVCQDEEPQIVDIPHTLSEMQQLVGGYIEIVEPFDDDIALVCNENGRNDGKLLNCVIGSNWDIYGNFFLCRYGENDLEDIPEEKIDKYASIFKIPRDCDTSAIEEVNRPMYELVH